MAQAHLSLSSFAVPPRCHLRAAPRHLRFHLFGCLIRALLCASSWCFFSVLLESANLLTAFRSLKLPPLARSSGKRQQRPGKTSRLGQTGRLANCPVRCNRTFACGCQIKDNHFVNEVAHCHRLVVCHGGSFIFGTISLRPSFLWGGREGGNGLLFDGS